MSKEGIVTAATEEAEEDARIVAEDIKISRGIKADLIGKKIFGESTWRGFRAVGSMSLFIMSWIASLLLIGSVSIAYNPTFWWAAFALFGITLTVGVIAVAILLYQREVAEGLVRKRARESFSYSS